MVENVLAGKAGPWGRHFMASSLLPTASVCVCVCVRAGLIPNRALSFSRHLSCPERLLES